MLLTVIARKDEDGKPITGPINFLTKKGKNGKDDSVYFSKPTYVSVDDKYVTPLERVNRTEVKDGW